MTTLFEKNIEECAGVKMVSGGKVYYRTLGYSGAADAGFLYSYDLNTGKTGTACAMSTRWQLGGSYAQCTDPETGETIIYDMAADKKLPYELEKGNAVWNVADNGFVMSLDSEASMDYYFVQQAALADGLQEADLQFLYSRKMGYS